MVGQTVPERMTGADWIEDLCRAARRHDLSLYLLGAKPEVVEGAADALSTRYPGLRIVGASDGYDVGPDTIAEINRSRPDILLVGMGPPRQEKWIARHRAALNVPVVWAVGGLFDVVSGCVPRGPRWMTQHGLEWLCRLVVEPRRLWRRYVLGNPRFLWRVVMSRAAANALIRNSRALGGRHSVVGAPLVGALPADDDRYRWRSSLASDVAQQASSSPPAHGRAARLLPRLSAWSRPFCRGRTPKPTAGYPPRPPGHLWLPRGMFCGIRKRAQQELAPTRPIRQPTPIPVGLGLPHPDDYPLLRRAAEGADSGG
jgi:exopolysaccharide biosynthesis WecB/TagA/CpsF family protein